MTVKVWEFLNALAVFVADGCTTVTREQYKQRLLICQHCEYRNGGACALCGCRLALKAQARAWLCPIEKWTDISREPEPALEDSENSR